MQLNKYFWSRMTSAPSPSHVPWYHVPPLPSWCIPFPSQPYPTPVPSCTAPTSASWPLRLVESLERRGLRQFAVAQRVCCFPRTRWPALFRRSQRSSCFCLVPQSIRWMVSVCRKDQRLCRPLLTNFCCPFLLEAFVIGPLFFSCAHFLLYPVSSH